MAIFWHVHHATFGNCRSVHIRQVWLRGIILLTLLYLNVFISFAKSGHVPSILWIIVLTFVYVQATRACFFLHPSRWE